MNSQHCASGDKMQVRVVQAYADNTIVRTEFASLVDNLRPFTRSPPFANAANHSMHSPAKLQSKVLGTRIWVPIPVHGQYSQPPLELVLKPPDPSQALVPTCSCRRFMLPSRSHRRQLK